MNDTPSSFFSGSCGSRQGDTLSPLLFVIMMEALGIIIYVAVSRGLVSSFSVGTGNVFGLDISHLLFADGHFNFLWGKPISPPSFATLVIMF